MQKEYMFMLGWFSEIGQRINLNPESRSFLSVYDGSEHSIFQGMLTFSGESFTGNVEDHCGKAIIEGALTGDIFEFTKKYEHRRDIIRYRFRREGNDGLWVGGYEGHAVGDGSSRVVLTKLPPAFFSSHPL